MRDVTGNPGGARVPPPPDAAPLRRLARALRANAPRRVVHAVVVHRPPATPVGLDAVAPGVVARSLDDFVREPPA